MDIEQIDELINLLEGSKVSEISIRKDDSMVLVRKSPVNLVLAPVSAQPAHKQSRESERIDETMEEQKGVLITAPVVGIFHAINGLPVRGDRVKRGQSVGAIESMKLMNDVVSPDDGVIVDVYVEDGMPVEYGHVLFRIEPEGEGDGKK